MTPLRRSRSTLAVAGVLSAALLLVGCSSETAGTASPASSSTDSSSSPASPSGSAEPSGSEDLTPGLLPAEAFGPGAVATPLTEAELAASAAQAGEVADLTITPESCDQAVAGSQVGTEDLDSFAAQSVSSGASTWVQLLNTGGDGGAAVGALASAAASCPEATISSPAIGTVTVTFTPVEVPALGDGSAAVQYTTTITGPDGVPITVPAVIGLVQDGDRLLTLVTLSPTGPLDTAAFGPLLQQAFDQQTEALD